VDVGRPSEDEGVQVGRFHLGQEPIPPIVAQPSEVDPTAVFQGHDTNEDPSVAGNGAHAVTP
jgi:hypothetical protein